MKSQIFHRNLVFLIISLMIISGCTDKNKKEPTNEDLENPKNAEIDVSYEITISNISTTSLFLVPRIINLHSNHSNMYDREVTDVTNISEMQFTNGNGIISENASSFGSTIKVQCSENCTLEYNQSFSLNYNPPDYVDPHYILNLENLNSNWNDYKWSDETEYYIFYNGTSKFVNIKIEFEFLKDIGRSGFYTSISGEGKLTNGWNEIPAIRSTVFAD